ncbi:dihydrodipicolinate synthase family protein [Methylobacterium sp. J-030]|uniref:dihydrodipicolinate synthase family protein n=1 Tax=Methylobacterium sp. J-030 TaxID=2836627 RepID=UPI001FBB5287|nr:dihydrodipicolinate synthase family protein [Methylobacterium sp. J-030]MCJ2071348.1 dihydrodipicolinate synthase family protein [Methylobacterium sp. J-030]
MDQLWVPILTHYRGGSVDPDRMGMHMRSLQPHVRSVLVAGSTGDGWDLDARGFDEALEVLRDAEAFSSQVEVLIGLLQPSTERVLARLDQVTAFLGRTAIAARIVGVAVCPPVDGDIDQAGIVRHFMAVIDASPWPVSLYQLPQVTGCSLEPKTVSALARHRNVAMFKDSSGADLVALADDDYGDLLLVRGAEGSYAAHLRPQGRYHGWLLSTGNAFAAPLRDILRAHADSRFAHAADISRRLGADIDRLFADAATVPFGNAFSNANRAADHILAYGSAGWRNVEPPETISGLPLPIHLLATADRIISEHIETIRSGYLR